MSNISLSMDLYLNGVKFKPNWQALNFKKCLSHNWNKFSKLLTLKLLFSLD